MPRRPTGRVQAGVRGVLIGKLIENRLRVAPPNIGLCACFNAGVGPAEPKKAGDELDHPYGGARFGCADNVGVGEYRRAEPWCVAWSLC